MNVMSEGHMIYNEYKTNINISLFLSAIQSLLIFHNNINYPV